MLRHLVCLGVFALLALSAPADQSAGNCHEYVLMNARGTFEPQGPSIGFRGMIRQTLDSAPGGIEYAVKYPAAFDATQMTTLIGSQDIETYINDGTTACPDQKYVLMGYSQGATCVLEALKTLTGTEAEKNIKAVVFIGNPYQVSNQKSTVDETGGQSTRSSQGILLPLSRPIGLASQWANSGKVLNICYKGDAVCNGVSLDTLNAQHLVYGFNPSVQKMGSDFVVSKLKE